MRWMRSRPAPCVVDRASSFFPLCRKRGGRGERREGAVAGVFLSPFYLYFILLFFALFSSHPHNPPPPPLPSSLNLIRGPRHGRTSRQRRRRKKLTRDPVEARVQQASNSNTCMRAGLLRVSVSTLRHRPERPPPSSSHLCDGTISFSRSLNHGTASRRRVDSSQSTSLYRREPPQCKRRGRSRKPRPSDELPLEVSYPCLLCTMYLFVDDGRAAFPVRPGSLAPETRPIMAWH
ncbi:hypothetical protein LZ30DRAFT_147655 [Colletotrichum cereale]|nr:hypothetical protein LZ30DRAFT_147655 [Colletotrichum cereale]